MWQNHWKVKAITRQRLYDGILMREEIQHTSAWQQDNFLYPTKILTKKRGNILCSAVKDKTKIPGDSPPLIVFEKWRTEAVAPPKQWRALCLLSIALPVAVSSYSVLSLSKMFFVVLLSPSVSQIPALFSLHLLVASHSVLHSGCFFFVMFFLLSPLSSEICKSVFPLTPFASNATFETWLFDLNFTYNHHQNPNEKVATHKKQFDQKTLTYCVYMMLEKVNFLCYFNWNWTFKTR